jgi:hypothetical protein
MDPAAGVHLRDKSIRKDRLLDQRAESRASSLWAKNQVRQAPSKELQNSSGS